MTGVFRPGKLALSRKFFLKALHVAPACGAAYVNNPKVACSTIKMALQRTQVGDPEYLPATSVHDYAESPLLTWPDVTLERAGGLLDKHFTFSFVRCPYRRLQSAYVNKIFKPQKQGAPRMQAGFGRHERPTFDAFVEAITAQDSTDHNPHWRAQHINLSVDAVQYDFIGKLEKFAQDWATLSARLDLPPEPERAGKTTDPSHAAYTVRTAALVAQSYARDFDVFGYDSNNVP
jgi:hypothetical protein